MHIIKVECRMRNREYSTATVARYYAKILYVIDWHEVEILSNHKLMHTRIPAYMAFG